MSIPETHYKWTLTSTGASTNVFEGFGPRTAQNFTFSCQTEGSATTAAIGIEAGVPSDALTVGVSAKFERMGSTLYTLSSLAATIIQVTGPLAAIRPYVIDKTNSTTVVQIVLLGA